MSYLSYTIHHAGIFLITIALSFLLFHSFNNRINAPALFFILYGIGGLLLAYEMHAMQNKYDIAPLEVAGGIIALYLGYTMLRQRKSLF